MKKNLCNERGQFTLEAILICTVLVSVVLLASKQMKSNGFAASLIEGPWAQVEGMIENGVWVSAKKAKAYHPSLRSRHGSREGDPDT